MSTRFELPQNTVAAVLICFGDSDDDGGSGIKVKIYDDIPLDAQEAREMIALPEFEAPIPNMADTFMGIIPGLAGIVSGIMSFAGMSKEKAPEE